MLIDRWRSAADRGVYDAMNRGLLMARGRYVLFLNAGDRFAAPDVLGRVLPELESSRAPDLLFAGTILDLPHGRHHNRPARPAERYLRYGLPACHQATFFRRSLHLRYRYDLGYQVTADYAAIARMLVGGATTRCLSLDLAVRHCDRTSLSERRWAMRIAEACRVQREILMLPLAVRAIGMLRLCLTQVAYVCVRDRPRLSGPVWRSGLIRMADDLSMRLFCRTVF
jgi:putative colanic acid biosynthesis glycosyltransferase